MTDAQTLTQALGGTWHGRYGRACCPVCGNSNIRNPALSIKDGAGGKLLLWCFKGCAYPDIVDALGLRGDFTPPSREDIRRHREEQDAEAIKKATRAKDCWLDTQPIEGTLAEAYLRRRGITCDLPDSLRFHPYCFHGPTAKRFPAGSRAFARCCKCPPVARRAAD